MDTPFESNLSFPTTASVENEQMYLEKPMMLQAVDANDFSQPIFVEIKPLLSMQEAIEDYATWTELNEINGTTSIFKDRDASLLNSSGVDRGQDKVPIPMAARDGPSLTSNFATINPVLLDISSGESTTEIQCTEGPGGFSQSMISIPQQDEAAAADIGCLDSAAASKYDHLDNPLEQYLSETLLEQDTATAEPDTDPSGMNGDPNLRTHLEEQNQMLSVPQHIDDRQDHDATHALSLGEHASVVPQAEVWGGHDTTRLEQVKVTAELDTNSDTSGMDGDTDVRTHLEEQNQMLSVPQRTYVRHDGTIHAVSLGEPASVVPKAEVLGSHDVVIPLPHAENDNNLGNEAPPQVVDGTFDLEIKPAVAQEKNFEEPIERSNGTSVCHADDCKLVPGDLLCSQETTISTLTSADAPAAKDAQPVKRRRMMFDAVVVPPLSPAAKKKYVNPKNQAEAKTLELKKSKEMMKHLKNPKVKNNRTPKLSADTVRDRLQQIGLDVFPIVLSKFLTDATFQRDMLSHHYGGNLRATFPKIRRDMVASHGLDDFMYINLQHNPHAPEVPGAPGLWYTVGQAKSIARAHTWAKEQRVLSRLVTGIWQYQGQYALIPADSLTKDEWGAQDVKLRNTWAQEIHTRAWGRPTRARIALRARLGRPPTQAELAAALEGDSKYGEVTSAQIAGALLKGEETMAVWAMKCVGYDENFQKDLIEKQKTWVSPRKKAKNGTGKKTKAAPKAGGSRKRKAEVLDPGSSSDDDEDLPDSDDDEIQIVSRIKWLASQRRPRHTT